MAKVSQIEQDGVYYDIYDSEALHGAVDADTIGAEITSHKVTVIFEGSDNIEYPTARAVYNFITGKVVQDIDEHATEDTIPSAKAVWDLFTSLVDVNEEYF